MILNRRTFMAALAAFGVGGANTGAVIPVVNGTTGRFHIDPKEAIIPIVDTTSRFPQGRTLNALNVGDMVALRLHATQLTDEVRFVRVVSMRWSHGNVTVEFTGGGRTYTIESPCPAIGG